VACAAGTRRSALSLLEAARKQAARLDEKLQADVNQVSLPAARNVFIRLRAHLFERSQDMQTWNDVDSKLKKAPNRDGSVSISLGPSIDKGRTPVHFHFDSGARLSFGITLREARSGSYLVAYRFHFHLPTERLPEFLRFDLNPQVHDNPLGEPRCHLHPGQEPVRLPLPALDPYGAPRGGWGLYWMGAGKSESESRPREGGAGTPETQQCPDDDDLHPRAEPRRPRRSQSPRSAPQAGPAVSLTRLEVSSQMGRNSLQCKKLPAMPRRRWFHLRPTGAGFMQVGLNT